MTPDERNDEPPREHVRPVNRNGGRRDGGMTLAKWIREEARRREEAALELRTKARALSVDQGS